MREQRRDKQQHFDSQKQHLNNIQKNNYGQIQDLKKSDFYTPKKITDNFKLKVFNLFQTDPLH